MAPSPTTKGSVANLVAHQVDHRAVGGDRADLAVLLPQRGRRALDDVDDDAIGIELAHARLLDQRQRFERLARLGGVEERAATFGAMPASERISRSGSCDSPEIVTAATPKPSARAA